MLNSRTLATLVALTCAAAPLHAQSIGKQLARTGMTQDDVNIMVDAASELFSSGNATVGADTIWQNPETDAHGLAEVVEVEGNCVRVAYKFRTTKQPNQHVVNIRRCLTDGKWLLSD